ncbi:glutamine--fructose-6-phosphate transaminase (isomerizing) [Leptolyngbya sp. FACHB-261]|uniref:glutamine--fructose-6-phosphate transaminase (isomerizing) n=1 Tax=Leptolyngbya sp. FACHB-261 TaxID=2692806 RepID=UPI001686F2C8|nr:glutamine--fructose-6-phosphate transaminase (isomerizing) [Leptolyngbya sp. FACHB-261]MBD2103013.1 glutamine--fructose-6-phosphate transaminase (isomerizing) [Leptolyngbya sp. FACHB-261]
MCGIVGYIGTRSADEILLEGLRKLEYRGYDSAGVATVWEGNLHCTRAKGKLQNLLDKLSQDPITHRGATVGIGHTRWATHGKPEEHNAHPHTDASGRLAVVLNGIIENYHLLREELKQRGHVFRSETDAEVIPHLISEFLPEHTLLEAVRLAVAQLQGGFAIAVISADHPDELVAARQQNPLVVGFGEGEFFFASDTPALVAYTRSILPLGNGELVRLTYTGVEVYNFEGVRLRKQPRTLNWNPMLLEKQGFKHFMLKEIHEQPGVVRACLEAYLPNAKPGQSPIDLRFDTDFLKDIQNIQIVACGTSWHAALVGKYLLEQLAGVPTMVHYASEFRYAPPPVIPNTLTIGVTQSGETADTLAALQKAKQRGDSLLGITNRPESLLAELVPYVIDMKAGVEIGVAATKTFLAQLIVFYLLALEISYLRQTLSPEALEEIITGLRQLPAQIETVLESQERYVEQLAHQFVDTRDFIYLGRGINYPIALEGALKLKEISYIHAEGYPAGEMKHGPIALLDQHVPVVTIAMPGLVYEKVLSNAQEAKARDARLIGVAPLNDPLATEIFDALLPVPNVDELLSPIVSVIPLQLLAYHIAAHRGLDVDQPRNLAKSVTVE